MVIAEYTEKEYHLFWDEEKEMVRSTLFDGFCFDSAVQFKEDAMAMAREINLAGVAKIRVLNDISGLSDEYRLDYRTQAVLLDVMEAVSRMAVVAKSKPHILQSLFDFFDAVNFVVQGRRMAHFETQEEAEKWLLKK